MKIEKCNSCDGDLEQGALVDYTYGGILVQRYAKTNDMPTGSKIQLGGFEANLQDMRRVHAKRCTSCNRVVLFAQDHITAGDSNSHNKNVNKFFKIIFIILIPTLILTTLLAVLSYFVPFNL
jgi:hypothetical protein